MSVLHRADDVQQQNPDGTWGQAIPVPFYGQSIRFPLIFSFRSWYGCECGRRFNTEQAYRDHWITENLASRYRDDTHPVPATRGGADA